MFSIKKFTLLFMLGASVLAISLIYPATSIAGEGVWRHLGLEGKNINTIAIDPKNPDIIYAGGEDGVFKSTDRGTSWEGRNDGLDRLPPQAGGGLLARPEKILIDPINPQTLYLMSVLSHIGKNYRTFWEVTHLIYIKSTSRGTRKMDLSDETLVKQVLSGNTDSFSVLVERYQNTVFALAFSMVKNAEDARDLTQESFIKAYVQRYGLYGYI